MGTSFFDIDHLPKYLNWFVGAFLLLAMWVMVTAFLIPIMKDAGISELYTAIGTAVMLAGCMVLAYKMK